MNAQSTDPTADTRRVTIVSARRGERDRGWNRSATAATRAVFIDSPVVLRSAIGGALYDATVDVERVIIDCSAGAAEYLDLLTRMAPRFTGDFLFIAPDDSGYLSATGRGGDRVLYALTAQDVRFYLEATGLIAQKAAVDPLSEVKVFHTSATALSRPVQLPSPRRGEGGAQRRMRG